MLQTYFIAFLWLVLTGASAWGGGFACETADNTRILVDQETPLAGQPTRTLKMTIEQSGEILLSTARIELYREGTVFNFLVRGGQNFPASVASLQLEFPSWRDFLYEREFIEGEFLVREGTTWTRVSAECFGQPHS